MRKIYSHEPTIHNTTLEKIVFDAGALTGEFDDSHEVRRRIVFAPCQAIKITTIDCFDMRSILMNGTLERYILELEDSQWIKELEGELHSNDHSATFMDRAHHFVLPFHDDILEV